MKTSMYIGAIYKHTPRDCHAIEERRPWRSRAFLLNVFRGNWEVIDCILPSPLCLKPVESFSSIWYSFPRIKMCWSWNTMFDFCFCFLLLFTNRSLVWNAQSCWPILDMRLTRIKLELQKPLVLSDLCFYCASTAYKTFKLHPKMKTHTYISNL